ncbi:MAG: UDP-glucose 4-epimerase GalE [Eubacteriales bacterium]|nr:UDP-glucose 4-epimerase GalE [Eubacteriales bacterium]
MVKTVLVTGGAGFIGSHTCVELLESNISVICVDDLSNSKQSVVDRIKSITGKELSFHKLNVCDETQLDRIFEMYDIDAVIHFAGYKAVGQSVEKPLMYYQNNLNSTITLLKCMAKHNVNRIVFSSSATVYGVPKVVPMNETADTWCTNPYGWTKYMSEQIIKDWCVATPNASAILLRYFNPIGAHFSGLIGEDPNGIPNNLLPYICQVAAGKLEYLRVFGDDYDTADGTGVRDYIHVVDLAKGHLKALEYIDANKGCQCVNLGTGKGYSVLDVVKAYQTACGIDIPYRIYPRRSGDIATSYADPKKAYELLGWKAERDLNDMCASAYNWQKMNPNGYGD